MSAEYDAKKAMENALDTAFKERTEAAQAYLNVLDDPGNAGEMRNELLAFLLERHSLVHEHKKDAIPEARMDNDQFNELVNELRNDDEVDSVLAPLCNDKPSPFEAAECVWEFLEKFKDNPEKRRVALSLALSVLTPYVGIKNPIKMSQKQLGAILDKWGFQFAKITMILEKKEFEQGSFDEALAILDILGELPNRKVRAAILGAVIQNLRRSR